MKTHNQKGFSHIVIVAAILVVAVAGFAGYRVLHVSNGSNAVSSKGSEPAKLQSSADVHKASKALDETAKADMNPSQLDADLNALL